MKDKIKAWIVQVFVSKAVPSFVRAGIAAMGVVFAAHEGLLTSMGIHSMSQGHQIVIDLNKLSDWMIIVGPGSLTAFLAIIQHHTVSYIKKKPAITP